MSSVAHGNPHMELPFATHDMESYGRGSIREVSETMITISPFLLYNAAEPGL